MPDITQADRDASATLLEKEAGRKTTTSMRVRGGDYDSHHFVQVFADLREAAVLAERERCAGIADELGGVRGPHDAVSLANKAQHVRARTIAQAIRIKP
jgi:hypothetical protein